MTDPGYRRNETRTTSYPSDGQGEVDGKAGRAGVEDLESGKYVYLEHEGSLERVEELERDLG
jgi:hypothetical protein